MKRTILMTALLFFNNMIHAQNGILFPDSNAVWVNTYYNLVVTPPDPTPVPVLAGVHKYCMDGRDTIINARSYSQIYFCDSAYKGGTRTDSGRVYFIPCDSLQEYILYDFNMTAAGGTFYNIYIEDFWGTPQVYAYVVAPNSVDSILINGTYRKRIGHIGAYWIEGIGNTQGLFISPDINVSNYFVDLNCMSQNDTTLYPNFSPSPCALNVGIADQEENNSDYLIYPNPVNDKFFVQCNRRANSLDVTIRNAIGENIHPFITSHGNLLEVNLAAYPAGLYSVTLNTGNNLFYHKIIKK